MLQITGEEAEWAAWLDEVYAKEREELSNRQAQSNNADYDFY